MIACVPCISVLWSFFPVWLTVSSTTYSSHSDTTTTTTTVLRPFVRDYPGEPVPEETLTHPPSSSSSSLYQLLPSTTIHSILLLVIFSVASRRVSSGVSGTGQLSFRSCNQQCQSTCLKPVAWPHSFFIHCQTPEGRVCSLSASCPMPIPWDLFMRDGMFCYLDIVTKMMAIV